MKGKPSKRDEIYKSKLLMLLMQHIGSANAIGMGELYQAVYGDSWRHRINDTRNLRHLITALRRDGVPICSRASCTSGGYWVASASSELAEYCQRIRSRAVKALALECRIRKISMAELVGQLSLEDA